tara:strand:- start:262 stop:390 length:129 start_codon:yes stop_codon:yes gene_type:complete
MGGTEMRGYLGARDFLSVLGLGDEEGRRRNGVRGEKKFSAKP